MAERTDASAETEVAPGVWPVVWATIVGGLAVLFGTTIVAVAIDPLARELDVSVSTIQWVSTAYLLALGVTIPLVGWAQRRLGGKRLWMIGLGIFMLASILCSLAWDATSLIVFRAVQGVGGGIIMPLMATLVMQAAQGRAIARVMSVVSMPAVLGPILGPVVGGLILDHLSWPFLFWVNVPFCVAGLILAGLMIPKDASTQKMPLDVIGFVLSALALVGLLYGLGNATKAGGFGRIDVLIPAMGGVVLLVGFALWAVARGSRALIDVRLLRHWPLASSSLLLFLSGFALYGAMLLLPLYFQQLRGLTPLVAGLLLIPQGVGTFLSRMVAGTLIERIGPRWVTIAGFVVLTIGTLPFVLADTTTNYVWVSVVLLVRGMGLGAVIIPLMSLAYEGLEHHEIPDASLISRIGQQLGGAFGTAVLAVILEGALHDRHGAQAASGAFQQAFWWASGFTLAAIVLSFLLPGATRPSSREPDSDPDAAVSDAAAG